MAVTVYIHDNKVVKSQNKVCIAPTITYVLDSITKTPICGIGTIVLASAWAASGKLRRTRRSSDNGELDIGSVAGVLDAAAEAAHCGVGNGFAVKAYDQSGAGNDVTSEGAIYDPKAVESGVVVAGPVAGQYAARFDLTGSTYGRWWKQASALMPTTPWSFLVAGIVEGGYQNRPWFLPTASAAEKSPGCRAYSDTYRMNISRANGGTNITNNQTALGNWMIIVGVFNGAGSVLRVNGHEETGTLEAQAAAVTLNIGVWMTGRAGAYCLWDGALTADERATVETVAKNGLGITW